tara:strand:- start:176 stop:655 length:480 start_codon:yes stop_codon:yes gene_type:complete
MKKITKQLLLFSDYQNDNEIISNNKNDVRTGDAGQKIAEGILQKHGINTCRAAEGLTYDTIAEVNIYGKTKFIRIQTKTKSKSSKSMSYTFTKGYHRSYTGAKPYDADDYDISCCVNLADVKVLFSPGVVKSLTWSRSVFLRNNADIESWENSIKQINK